MGASKESIFSAEAPRYRAKISPSPEDEPVSTAIDQASSLSSPGSPMNLFGQEDGSSLRTYPDYFPALAELEADETSRSYSRRWPISGFTTSPGACWTADTSECPSDADASTSLADVLLETVPERFFLSPRAAAGILRRAAKRGRELPPQLREALAALASQQQDDDKRTTTTTPKPDISSLAPSDPTLDPPATQPMSFSENSRDEVVENPIAMSIKTGGGKAGQSYPAARIGSTVRRLTPTECERLQGFPDGWTIP